MIKIGAVKTIFEAFEKHIGEDVLPASRYKMTPVEAVALIKSAGGAPVLVPGLNRPGYLLEDLIKPASPASRLIIRLIQMNSQLF